MELCSRPKVRLNYERHVFVVPRGDGAPLPMTRQLRDVQLPVNAHGQREIAIERRIFADEPQPRRRRHSAAAGGGGGGGWCHSAGEGGSASRVPPSHDVHKVVFTNATAIAYQSYNVTKLKGRGQRELRVIGIDREKFHNLAPANAAEEDTGASSLRDWLLKSAGVRQAQSGTKHPYYYIENVADTPYVEEEGGGRVFRVAFREAHASAHEHSSRRAPVKEYRYEAQTPQEAAEIVAKLKHIMSFTGAASAESVEHGGFSGGLPVPSAIAGGTADREARGGATRRRGSVL